MPPKTPRTEVEVLQKALEQTVKDTAFKSEAAKMQVDIEWNRKKQTKNMFCV